MPLKIYIYTAALNEEKFVEAWVDACKDADGLYVLDTGSTDNTVAKLRTHNVRVVEAKFTKWKSVAEYYEVVARGERPWRFDTARQMNLDMLPADADVCLQVDMDEKPVSNWREIINAHWQHGTTQLNYLYGWRMDGDIPVIAIQYNKCHARQGYHWQKPIHEVVCAKPGTVEKLTFINELLVRHYPETKDRTQYLHMLELSCIEFPDDPVDRFYYCRELYFHKLWDQAIAVAQEFLALPRSNWDLQRCMACIYIADAYEAMGDKLRQEKWLLRACAEEPAQREGWYCLSVYYRKAGRHLDGYVAAKRALAITHNPKTYLQLIDAWGASPHDEAAVTGWYAGYKKEALDHGWEALRQNPHNDHLISNYEAMVSCGGDVIETKPTAPLDVIVLSWSKNETQYNLARRCISALRQSSPGAVLNIVVVETHKGLTSEPWYLSDGFGAETFTLTPDEPFGYNLYLQKAYAHLNGSSAQSVLILNNDLAAFSVSFVSEMLSFGKLFPSVSPLGLREARWGHIDQKATIHVSYDLNCLNGWCILIDKKIFKAAPFEAYFPAELEFHNQDVYYAAMLDYYGHRHALTTKAQALHLQSKSLSMLPEDEQKRLTVGQQAVLDSLISRNIHRSQVYDCFTFFNELDTLEIRLETLDAVVDKFVLVESNKTHSGQDKPYYYLENCERFKKFWPKIIRVAVTDMPPSNPDWRWTLENFQRNSIMRGLTDCRATDFIMISDADEIPNPDLVQRRIFGAYKQDMYNYYYNVRNTVEDWTGTVATTYGELLKKDPQNFRDYRHHLPWIRNGGWHFSWIGDLDAAKQKLTAFAHGEYDTPEVREGMSKRLDGLQDFAGRSEHRFMVVPVDENLPDFIRNHQDRFRLHAIS